MKTEKRYNLVKKNKTIFNSLMALYQESEINEIESLDCDRSGDIYCDCLSNARKLVKNTLDISKPEYNDICHALVTLYEIVENHETDNNDLDTFDNAKKQVDKIFNKE